MKLVSLQVNRSPLLRMLILLPVQAILSQDPQPVNYILIKLMLLSNSTILVSTEVGTKTSIEDEVEEGTLTIIRKISSAKFVSNEDTMQSNAIIILTYLSPLQSSLLNLLKH
jgi:hypothetical protein